MSARAGEAPRSIAKGHPRLLFATLMLGQMSQSVTFTAFTAAVPQMAHDLGSRGPYIAQMTMALASLGLMLGSIISGWVLEKSGTRATLITALLTFGVAGAGGLMFRDPVLLLASRFILGFASACIATTCLWGIAAEYDGDMRAKVLGISASISNFGALATTILGGYIAQWGWAFAFVQYPVFGLIGCLLAFVSLRQVRPELQRAGEKSRPYFKRLLPFYFLTAFLFAALFMSPIQFAFILEEDGIRNPATRALFIATSTAIGALTSFCYGPIQKRLTALGTFTFGLTCMALALTVIGWSKSPASLVLGAVLLGLYIGLFPPYIYHVVSDQTDSFSRSRAIGLLSAFGFLGGFLNPVVFAPLSAAIGLRNVFFVAAAAMAALALGTATLLVRKKLAMRARTALP